MLPPSVVPSCGNHKAAGVARLHPYPSSRKPMRWQRLSGIVRQTLRCVARSRLALRAAGMTGGTAGLRQYDLGRPSAFSAMLQRMSSRETGAMRAIMTSRSSRSTWNSLA